uniref:Ovule protein n=1 Tax=Parastrongyloides trichosuri TaxID=131310 RepID=A0A0N5A3V4_PARTI
MNLQANYSKKKNEEFTVKAGHLAPPMVRPNSPRPQRANTPTETTCVSLSTGNCIRLETGGLIKKEMSTTNAK